MYGNVWEWVEDDWHIIFEGAPSDGSAWIDNPRGKSRVPRGCSWCSYNCNHSNRYGNTPFDNASDIGFRLAMTVDSSS